MAKVFS